MNSDHIVKSFDEELQQLNAVVLRMGGVAEAQLAGAIDALVRRDSDLAQKVVASDEAIDEMDLELDENAVRTLALRQPMANDLREVISALKISSDLERIGDYAKNVAKRAQALNQLAPHEATRSIPRMAKLVQAIIKDVLDAYANHDPNRALDVWHRDEEVDEMYTALFRELLTYMMEDPRNITPCTHLLFIAKNIERIGDHATNIAETTHYLTTGKRIQGGRPKSDLSSFQVVNPEDAQEGGTEDKEGA
ncbi:phosphate signaling complex protein PhoU [Pelagibius marinus]|uniref:phosphate signaling complex protein PhoU n=1 Tax=Pelagibius marinus TaxID=2762760 RepID=UPI00187257FB|nr:phosphate signaling complex protein PhoU [Pelagibius marinus]